MLFFLLLTLWGSPSFAKADATLSQLKVPPGFKIDYFAQDIKNARSMTRGDDGVIYVGSMEEGKVYALVDKDHDGHADETTVLLSGLNLPNGVAYYKGDLYIAEIQRIIKLEKINLKNLKQKWRPTEVYTKLPDKRHHGWRYIHFGPDQKLYIGIGAPCNICQPQEPFGTIARIDLKTSKLEIYARGIRNSVGFDWQPESKDLWFSDNGRDLLGDDTPPDEINIAPKTGMNFGYPYLHGSSVQDPKFGAKKPKDLKITVPAYENHAHVANLGIHFYRGNLFPKQYQGQLFVAEHGSWNRSKKIGYQIRLIKLKDTTHVANSSVFISGWLTSKEEVLGRPVDLLELSDGSLLISDDQHNAIYRVSYKK